MSIKIGSNIVIDNSRNGKFIIGNIKSYTSDQLSSTPGTAVGQIAYESTGDKLVHWNGSKWVGMSLSISVTANNTGSFNGRNYAYFSSPGSIVVNGSGSVDLIVVGGGGGGGSSISGDAGGGGAGAFISETFPVTYGTVTVTVGQGGTANNNGQDTTLSGGGLSITATGGGGANGPVGSRPQSSPLVGSQGGSGGGGAWGDASGGQALNLNYGNPGGDGTQQNAGGGGGAGGSGAPASAPGAAGGGRGGFGKALPSNVQGAFPGVPTITYPTVAAGGGGSDFPSNSVNADPSAGPGSIGQQGVQLNASVNSGSGGGGIGSSGTGGTGGSGFVIISWV